MYYILEGVVVIIGESGNFCHIDPKRPKIGSGKGFKRNGCRGRLWNARWGYVNIMRKVRKNQSEIAMWVGYGYILMNGV